MLMDYGKIGDYSECRIIWIRQSQKRIQERVTIAPAMMSSTIRAASR
jgi:hypothetical protein